MKDSLLHRSRLLLQPYLPAPVIGLGAWARLLHKTGGFRRSRDLRRRWAARLEGQSGSVPLHEFEDRVLSQNGEDGLVEAIFQVIGFQTRTVLEFGFAATEATLLNLALTHNLEACFLDGSQNTCQMAAALFRLLNRPRFRVQQAFMTVENINQVIGGMGLKGEIDALSVDVEGNDYWLWKALHVVNPRLVIAEYSDWLGPVASVGVAYDPAFRRSDGSWELYRGASLTAMTKLAAEKGYRLIGSESSGVSAFFLREDIAAPSFPTLAVEQAFRYSPGTEARTPQQQDAIIAALPFVPL